MTTPCEATDNNLRLHAQATNHCTQNGTTPVCMAELSWTHLPQVVGLSAHGQTPSRSLLNSACTRRLAIQVVTIAGPQGTPFWSKCILTYSCEAFMQLRQVPVTKQGAAAPRMSLLSHPAPTGLTPSHHTTAATAHERHSNSCTDCSNTCKCMRSAA